VSIKFRAIARGTPNCGLRFFSYPASKPGLFNFDEVYLQTGPLLIAKSEMCAAVMMSAGFTACGFTSGENAYRSLDTIKNALILAHPKVYVADNDSAGHKYGEARATLFDAQLRFPPDPYKDWDEWLLAEPQACMEATSLWLEGK
jgi:hypothetical protein